MPTEIIPLYSQVVTLIYNVALPAACFGYLLVAVLVGTLSLLLSRVLLLLGLLGVAPTSIPISFMLQLVLSLGQCANDVILLFTLSLFILSSHYGLPLQLSDPPKRHGV